MRNVLLVAAMLWCMAPMMAGEIDSDVYRQLISNGADFETFRALMRSDSPWADAAVHTNYRGRGDTTGKSTAKKITECQVSIKGPENSTEVEDPLIATKVVCGKDVLYDKEEKLSELQEQDLKNGIILFANTVHDGAAYLYVSHAQDLRFADSEFLNLGKFVDQKMAAAVVVEGGLAKFNSCKFIGNTGGTMAGAIVVGGGAGVDITKSDFMGNEGEVGAIRALGSSKLDIEDNYFEANKGNTAGVLMVQDRVIFTGKKMDCYANSATERASAVFCTTDTSGFLDEVQFEGIDREDDLQDFLVSDDFDRNKLEDYKLARAGAVELDSRAFVSLTQVTFKKNSAMYGAVISSGRAVLNIGFSTFEQNLALNGAGVYVEGERGSYARVMTSNFNGNVANNGGALVVAGNGTFVVDECTFGGNSARNGGAVWGDYSNSDLASGGTCERTAQGSRVEIHKSEFTDNVAYENGGAFFIKCTDIQTNISNFYRNHAHQNGGAMLVEDVYDTMMIDSDFGENSAGASGGSLYVKNSHDIISLRSNFSQGKAEENGGAITSIEGNAIRLTDSKVLLNHATNGHGGAIHSEAVKHIEAEASEIRKNSAGGAGGALSVHDLEELHLSNVDLSKNLAADAGGAIRASNGQKATVQKVIVTGIVAGSGPISLNSMDDVLVTDIDFHDNEAIDKCGALEIDGATSLNLNAVSFRKNKAMGEGGGLCVSNAELAEIADVTFDENAAENGGGAILFNANKKVQLSNVKFTKNTCAVDGGAIKGQDVESLLLQKTTFDSNQAVSKGGAVYLHKSSLEIQKCVFEQNYVGPVRSVPETEDPEATAEEPQASAMAPESSEVLELPAISNTATRESGGVVYVSYGKSFISNYTDYLYNTAADVGGALMLEYMDSAHIEFDTYLNGTASLSGGCIYGNSVRNFKLGVTLMQHCQAAHGGAFILEGKSTIQGEHNFFFNNTARSGGAFLCKGNSHVSMESTNFSYNAAQEGATVAVDCRCEVDFSTSAFYRDKHLRGNGDFFHARKGCGAVNANECQFYGERDKNGFTFIQICLVGLICGILLCFFVFVFVYRRRRRQAAAAHSADPDVETGESAPLIPDRNKRPPEKLLSFSEDYSSSYVTESDYDDDDDDDDFEEDESEESDDIEVAGKKGMHKSAPVDQSDSEEDSIIESSSVRDRAEDELPVSTNAHDPIGVRSAKEVRAAARHRQASAAVVNDGAGPSKMKEDILPPPLPDKMHLQVSVDEPLPQYFDTKDATE